MQVLRYWIRAIAIDMATLWLLAYHLETGSAGAARVFQLWVWATTIVMLLFGLCGDRSFIEKPRPWGFKLYHGLTEILLISAMAWAGMSFLAAFRVVTTLLFEVAREREPKPKAKEPA